MDPFILKPYVPYFLSAFLVMILAEAVWAWRRGKPIYNGRETLANLVIFLGNRLGRLFFAGWLFVVLGWFYRMTPLRVPETAWTLPLTVVFIDFVYYWEHRLLHTVRPFWAFHEVHHSSPWYNLTTSFRLNWLSPLIQPVFYIPAALLGFSPRQILVFFALNLIYQFWLHTEAVPPLGRLEGWLNTPSAHRVHHGSNRAYIDRNFGGILMVWDRLFGTYAAETEPVVYGTTKGFRGHGPVKAVLRGFADLVRGQATTQGETVAPRRAS